MVVFGTYSGGGEDDHTKSKVYKNIVLGEEMVFIYTRNQTMSGILQSANFLKELIKEVLNSQH